MDETKVIEHIVRAVNEAGSIRAVARDWGVSPSYLCDLLAGRRAPGPAILGPLGLRRVVTVTYEPVTHAARKAGK